MSETERGIPTCPIPRLVPAELLPPYSFVPGRFPHPISDPAGHSYGQEQPAPQPLDPERWQSNRDYLLALDLFNAGYYWEAHETWEGLWRLCPRDSATALFLKGLIRLAAAGVKVRQEMPTGVRSHARGARALFERAQALLPAGVERYLGLSISELLTSVEEIATNPPVAQNPEAEVERVLPVILVLTG